MIVGNPLKRLITERNLRIKDIMHKISRTIVEYVVSINIDTIVIGHNDGRKQSTGMGRKNNQNFVIAIPAKE